MNAVAENGFLPDLSGLSDETPIKCALFLCVVLQTRKVLSSGIISISGWRAQRSIFLLIMDECYIDILTVGVKHHRPYRLKCCSPKTGRPEKPYGVSLTSKRSSLPGLRSGLGWGVMR